MARLSVLALSLLLRLSAALNGGSVCLTARSCADCIQASSTCGWCSDESFLNVGEAMSARCDDLQSLSERHCPPEKIENPRGSVQIEKDHPVTNRRKDSTEKLKPEQITQIQPQKLSLTLRSGAAQNFLLKARLAEDVPLDLFFLMDLSTSVKDLEDMKRLGLDLMDLKETTSDLRVGFGSMENPVSSCSGTQDCSGCSGLKNVLKLTNRSSDSAHWVRQQQVSGIRDPNQDLPEGGFDTIREVAVCKEQIGWANRSRLLVVSTDKPVALSHQGDGSNGQDAPPVSELLRTLNEHNIYIIFVVTDNVLPFYQDMSRHIPKSAVRTLASNSSDVLQAVRAVAESLTSELTLRTSDLPEGVAMSVRSLCQDSAEWTSESRCANVSMGDEISFGVSVTTEGCPGDGGDRTVRLALLPFDQQVELVLKFICDCQCSNQSEPQSNKCSSKGALECGACRCDEGRIGTRCECDADFYLSNNDDSCRKDDGTDICSNNGDCVCGTCECKKRENPAEIYSGTYCECDNFNCDRSNNKLCGGHGRCECRKCICDTNYTGSACDCSLDQTSCLARNGQICNGRGTCECGVCKCTDPKFQGPTCEVCPICPGVCARNRACVQCRVWGAGPKAPACDGCNDWTLIKVKDVQDLPQPHDLNFPLTHCKERDHNDCWFYFALILLDGAQEIHAVEKQSCPTASFWSFGS